MKTTNPVEIDPVEAVNFLIESAPKFAKAKATRVYLEEFRKSKKALLMASCDEKAAVAREQYAYAHPEYTALLDGLRTAIEIEETLRWSLIASQLKVEVWRTREASARQEMKATQ